MRRRDTGEAAASRTTTWPASGPEELVGRVAPVLPLTARATNGSLRANGWPADEDTTSGERRLDDDGCWQLAAQTFAGRPKSSGAAAPASSATAKWILEMEEQREDDDDDEDQEVTLPAFSLPAGRPAPHQRGRTRRRRRRKSSLGRQVEWRRSIMVAVSLVCCLVIPIAHANTSAAAGSSGAAGLRSRDAGESSQPAIPFRQQPNASFSGKGAGLKALAAADDDYEREDENEDENKTTRPPRPPLVADSGDVGIGARVGGAERAPGETEAASVAAMTSGDIGEPNSAARDEELDGIGEVEANAGPLNQPADNLGAKSSGATNGRRPGAEDLGGEASSSSSWLSSAGGGELANPSARVDGSSSREVQLGGELQVIKNKGDKNNVAQAEADDNDSSSSSNGDENDDYNDYGAYVLYSGDELLRHDSNISPGAESSSSSSATESASSSSGGGGGSESDAEQGGAARSASSSANESPPFQVIFFAAMSPRKKLAGGRQPSTSAGEHQVATSLERRDATRGNASGTQSVVVASRLRRMEPQARPTPGDELGDDGLLDADDVKWLRRMKEIGSSFGSADSRREAQVHSGADDKPSSGIQPSIGGGGGGETKSAESSWRHQRRQQQQQHPEKIYANNAELGDAGDSAAADTSNRADASSVVEREASTRRKLGAHGSPVKHDDEPAPLADAAEGKFARRRNNYADDANNNNNNRSARNNSSDRVNDNEDSHDDELEENKAHTVYYWRLIWFVLPVGATFGNLLVIMAVYRERSLQSVTNYFIVSLAFSDLFVGLVVMPFAVYVLVNGVWELSDTICDIYVAVDVTSSTASILNLVAISIDRYRAVAYPIAYTASSSSTIAILTICGVWLISCAVGAPIIFGLNTTPGRKSSLCILYNSTFIFWSSLASFYIPCIAMIALYYRIFSAIRSRTKKAIQGHQQIAAPNQQPLKLAPAPAAAAPAIQASRKLQPPAQVGANNLALVVPSVIQPQRDGKSCNQWQPIAHDTRAETGNGVSLPPIASHNPCCGPGAVAGSDSFKQQDRLIERAHIGERPIAERSIIVPHRAGNDSEPATTTGPSKCPMGARFTGANPVMKLDEPLARILAASEPSSNDKTSYQSTSARDDALRLSSAPPNVSSDSGSRRCLLAAAQRLASCTCDSEHLSAVNTGDHPRQAGGHCLGRFMSQLATYQAAVAATAECRDESSDHLVCACLVLLTRSADRRRWEQVAKTESEDTLSHAGISSGDWPARAHRLFMEIESHGYLAPPGREAVSQAGPFPSTAAPQKLSLLTAKCKQVAGAVNGVTSTTTADDTTNVESSNDDNNNTTTYNGLPVASEHLLPLLEQQLEPLLKHNSAEFILAGSRCSRQSHVVESAKGCEQTESGGAACCDAENLAGAEASSGCCCCRQSQSSASSSSSNSSCCCCGQPTLETAKGDTDSEPTGISQLLASSESVSVCLMKPVVESPHLELATILYLPTKEGSSFSLVDHLVSCKPARADGRAVLLISRRECSEKAACQPEENTSTEYRRAEPSADRELVVCALCRATCLKGVALRVVAAGGDNASGSKIATKKPPLVEMPSLAPITNGPLQIGRHLSAADSMKPFNLNIKCRTKSNSSDCEYLARLIREEQQHQFKSKQLGSALLGPAAVDIAGTGRLESSQCDMSDYYDHINGSGDPSRCRSGSASSAGSTSMSESSRSDRSSSSASNCSITNDDFECPAVKDRSATGARRAYCHRRPSSSCATCGPCGATPAATLHVDGSIECGAIHNQSVESVAAHKTPFAHQLEPSSTVESNQVSEGLASAGKESSSGKELSSLFHATTANIKRRSMRLSQLIRGRRNNCNQVRAGTGSDDKQAKKRESSVSVDDEDANSSSGATRAAAAVANTFSATEGASQLQSNNIAACENDVNKPYRADSDTRRNPQATTGVIQSPVECLKSLTNMTQNEASSAAYGLESDNFGGYRALSSAQSTQSAVRGCGDLGNASCPKQIIWTPTSEVATTMDPSSSSVYSSTINKPRPSFLVSTVVQLMQRLPSIDQETSDNKSQPKQLKANSNVSSKARGNPDSLAMACNQANNINSGGNSKQHRVGSRRKREKNAARRERKATKTLAIVLGIFLICWTPFFTCNIIDGICIQLDMDCRPGMMVYLVTSWLGYINSCVNPIIYTIFNMEFRRAFKKILTTSPKCCRRD